MPRMSRQLHASGPTIQLTLTVFVIGLAAGQVLARAIVRDLFDGTAMTRFLSTLMLVNGVAPVAAPVIGGQLLTVATWRAVFAVLAGAGAALLLAVLFVVTSMLGVVLPNATALAMAGYRSAAGAASSLQGLLQFLVGAIAASAMGLGGQASAVPMGVTMFACAAGALWCVIRRGG
jgi:MFS family permease